MRIDVLGGPERRRRWTFAEKARIVEASFDAEASVCAIARRHGIAQGLLFTWRRQAREGRLGGPDQAPLFVPVATSLEPTPSVPALTPLASPGVAETPPARRSRRSVIEIDLGGGRRLKVDRDVDAAALRRVLDALDGR